VRIKVIGYRTEILFITGAVMGKKVGKKGRNLQDLCVVKERFRNCSFLMSKS
jgi:hypothetical protein